MWSVWANKELQTFHLFSVSAPPAKEYYYILSLHGEHYFQIQNYNTALNNLSLQLVKIYVSPDLVSFILGPVFLQDE